MGDARSAGPVARAWAVLRHPGGAWDGIAEEPAEPRWLFGRYVAWLAAIPAVCGTIGPLVFTFNVANVRLRPSAVALVLENLTAYAATFGGVWLLALWIALLAPAFGGVRDYRRALNLSAHSGTAAWAAGIFELYPSLGVPMAILSGVYSLYTLFLGLAKLTQAPVHRRLTYVASVLIGVFVLLALGAMLAARMAEFGGPLSLA